jgi:ATP-dependent Lhr-like helicase
VSSFDQLHPALQYHVVNSLGWASLRPTQLAAIPPVLAGDHCLLLAPTAGGKTEAAVIPVLSRMLTESWTGISVIYLCPIKALLNNLESRLSYYAGLVGRRVAVWHGDVSESRKKKLRADPPDILLTTPESLEGMLISPRTERAAWFGGLRTVIVDELHAFAGDDRGWHLRAVLARMEAYTARPAQRIGLSATVQNPESLLTWLAPTGNRQVVGSSSVSTDADVTIDHIGSLENAALIISRLYRGEKRLVFCDSRAAAERLGHELNQLGIRTFVSHASLSAAERKNAEEAFATERDCVIVATSTLELGIDVGDLDRVIQIDAPSTVSSFLQRMGRSGRRSGSRRSCLFLAISDQGFLQALGVTELWSRGWVEAVQAPALPWNVLAQQALLQTLEIGLVPSFELAQRLAASFPELPADGIKATLTHLLELGYLAEAEASVIQIGGQAQREFGGSHYRELLATFSGADLLLAKYGTQDVGYIDPSVLGGEDEAKLVLLAGRSWVVRAVDFGRRIVALEPAADTGKARWIGGTKTISEDVAKAIRAVLREGAGTVVTLSKRAKSRLEELQDEMPTAITPPAVRQLGPARFQVWTYAGTKRNRTLLATHRENGAMRANELCLDFRQAPKVPLDLHAPLPEPVPRIEWEPIAKTLKFAEMTEEGLLGTEIVARFYCGPT